MDQASSRPRRTFPRTDSGGLLQSLTSIRRDLRALVQARDYAQIDAYYDALEQRDWADTEDPGAPYFEAANSGTLFDYSMVPFQDAAAFLQDWIAASPGSYHAHLVLGNFCFGRAGDIRGYGWADSVTQDRWLGAALACERAAAALVQAMALSPRPIAACVTMMQMCAHFQEPYWLRQLFLGNAPETITHEDIDEPGMMDAALAHLVELGVPRLTPEQTPDALPSGLAPRAEHEMDQAKDYWLLRALDLRPGHLGALMAYAQYLRPRWGGSYEDIDGMAGGPLCAALSEPQRNAIRWIGILDSMGDYPEPDDAEAVAEYREMFESFLQRELRPEERGMALGFTRSSSAIRWRIRSRRARCTHRARRHFRRTAISATWTGRSAASRTSASSTACRTTTAPSRASWNACAIGIPWLRRRRWRRWPITTAAGVSRRTRRARSSCWTAPRCWRRTRRTTISTSWRRPPCCGMAATMSKAIS